MPLSVCGIAVLLGGIGGGVGGSRLSHIAKTWPAPRIESPARFGRLHVIDLAKSTIQVAFA